MKLIPLSGKNGAGKWAIVDDEDYAELSKFKWHFTSHGDAARMDGRQKVKMHRLISKSPHSIPIRHHNGDMLDNRRSNLLANGRSVFGTEIPKSHIPGTKLIPLTKGQFAIVDEEDFSRLSKYNWHLSSSGYAVRRGPKNSLVGMHRFILKIRKKLQGDHINLDRLDNRKSNLRNATPSQNQCNRTSLRGELKGVQKSCRKLSKPYQARIGIKRKLHHLGFFETQDAAVKAYKAAAKKHHGDFARTE